jgi:hypothetical protein
MADFRKRGKNYVLTKITIHTFSRDHVQSSYVQCSYDHGSYAQISHAQSSYSRSSYNSKSNWFEVPMDAKFLSLKVPASQISY